MNNPENLNPELNEGEGTEQQEDLVLSSLKQEADTLGIKYKSNIGVDSLSQKIEEHKLGLINAASTEQTTDKVETPAEENQRLKKELTKLVRIKLQVLNPNKSNTPGEWFCAGNSKIGMIKKYVPFDAKFYDKDKGYHVPYIIYLQMKERLFSNGRPGKVNGADTTVFNDQKEFSIEILPPLTEAELKALATEQKVEGRV